MLNLLERTLAVVNPNEKIIRLFEVKKMTDIIPVYESIEKTFNKILIFSEG